METYTKKSENELKVSVERTPIETVYSLEEIDQNLSVAQSNVAKWQTLKDKAIELGIKSKEENITE